MSNYLIALLLQALDEGRLLHGLAGLSGDVVDVLLALLHARHVVLQARQLLSCSSAITTDQMPSNPRTLL